MAGSLAEGETMKIINNVSAMSAAALESGAQFELTVDPIEEKAMELLAENRVHLRPYTCAFVSALEINEAIKEWIDRRQKGKR